LDTGSTHIDTDNDSQINTGYSWNDTAAL